MVSVSGRPPGALGRLRGLVLSLASVRDSVNAPRGNDHVYRRLRGLAEQEISEPDAAGATGLINNVLPRDQLVAEAERTARRICENGPLAVRTIKELAVRGQYMPIGYALRMEQATQKVLGATEDAKEGPKALTEKRKPSFKGK